MRKYNGNGNYALPDKPARLTIAPDWAFLSNLIKENTESNTVMALSVHFRCSDSICVWNWIEKIFPFYCLQAPYLLWMFTKSKPFLGFWNVSNFLEQKNKQKHEATKRIPIKNCSADFVPFNSVTNQLNQLKDTIFVLFVVIVSGLQSDL